MMDHDQQTPPTAQDTDLTKAQNQQPPERQATPQPDAFQTQQQPEGQANYGSAGQSDTLTEQRSDIEGGTTTGQATDIEGSSTFVGAKGTTDTSSEFVEDDHANDFAKDGQGAPE